MAGSIIISSMILDSIARFRDSLQGKPGPEDKPELISIHIPKTAGLSFREVLYANYGHNQVLAKNQMGLEAEGKRITALYRKRHKVIHGHLPYPLVRELHGPETKIVTWLREPVSRVVSNYYYNIHHEYPKRLKEDPDFRKPSLEEFVERPLRRNVMAHYLEGFPLESLYFFGFQESFAKDLSVLAGQLGWQLSGKLSSIRINDNRKAKSKYPALSESLRYRIQALNARDVELYERARELKH